MTTVGCLRFEGLWLDRPQSLCFHEFCGLSRTTDVTLLTNLNRNPTSSETPLVVSKDLVHFRNQSLLSCLTIRDVRRLPPVVSPASHLECFTDLPQRPRTFPRKSFHCRVHICYSLRPKIANAFFKMSRSRSTRLSSASSSRTLPSRDPATGPL